MPIYTLTVHAENFDEARELMHNVVDKATETGGNGWTIAVEDDEDEDAAPFPWRCPGCGEDMREAGLLTWQNVEVEQRVTLTTEEDGSVTPDYEAWGDGGDGSYCVAIHCGGCGEELPSDQELAIGQAIGDPIHAITPVKLAP